MATIIMLKTIIALGVLAMPTVLSATGGVPGSLSKFSHEITMYAESKDSYNRHWSFDNVEWSCSRSI
jgi:hypothetical protein